MTALESLPVHVEFLGTHKDILGESPFWDLDRRCLWRVDQRANAIRAVDHRGDVVADWTYSQPVGSVGPSSDGLVAAMADGFYRIDAETGSATLIAHVDPPAPGTRLNDGKSDRFGRFLSGHMHPTGGRAGELWRLDRDGSTHRLGGGFGVANSICFSPDGATMYVADSLDGILRRHAYDGATGTLGARENLVDCRIHGSGPDGATVDADGRIWVALVLAAKIACFAPDGRLLRTIDLPVPYPTCPAFGGDGLATLYVTSIANSGHRLVSDHPDAGRIVTIRGLDATGLPEGGYRPETVSRAGRA